MQAAQWLGVDKDAAIDNQGMQEAPVSCGQYAGLGFKKKGLVKSKKVSSGVVHSNFVQIFSSNIFSCRICGR
jgi:hypothetical protein